MLEEDEFMRIGEVARMFRVKTPTVRRWVKEGKLRSTVINHRHLFRRGDVMEMARYRKVPE